LIGLFMMEYTNDPQISIQNYRVFREKQIAEAAELDKVIEATEKSLKQTEMGKVHRSVFTVMSQLPFHRVPDYMRLTYGISLSQSSLDSIAALRYLTTGQITEGYTLERIAEIETDLLNQDRARVEITGDPYDLVTLVRNKISTEIYNAYQDKYEALGIQKKSKTRSDFTMMKLYEEYNELLKDPNADPVRLTEIKHELESIRKSSETDTDVLVEQLSEENTTIEAIDAEIERI